jgi:hypothetical protein
MIAHPSEVGYIPDRAIKAPWAAVPHPWLSKLVTVIG